MDKNFDVRKRKKQLIRLNIDSNANARAGKKLAAISVATHTIHLRITAS